MKKAHIVLIAVVALLVASPIILSNISNQLRTEELIINEMISQIDTQRIRETVTKLQSYNTRAAETPGNIEASTHLYNQLQAIPGLTVEYQGGTLRNIIATLPGKDPNSKEIYILGAHYDSTSNDPNQAPGATDNASGAAIVIELARVMSQSDYKHTVKFALWNGEETGLTGSHSYADHASDNNLNIKLYVNLDSSSYDPDNQYTLDIMDDDQSQWASSIFAEQNTKYKINFTLTHNLHTCTSDHTSFRTYGFPAIMTHQQTHGPAHTPSDTLENVNLTYAQKNGQLCMTVIAHLAAPQN